MKQIVTFILPTRNRKHFVRRAIDSCLACESEIVEPRVIVIDGESDDGTFFDLQQVYKHDERVYLIQNSKSAGFMNTCFQGVALVKSKWVTFMYDDDVLSPYFVNMVDEMLKGGDNFIMGYGAPSAADRIYPFRPIPSYRRYASSQVLLTYYGHERGIDFKGLPVSPICCITTIELLREWVPQVSRFCSQNSIRQYFMLKRNIGPDLMIYLLSLLKQDGKVPLAVASVAQFSEHPTSMSVVYGAADLKIGYWLAKIWAFEYLCQEGRRNEAALCAASILLVGARIVVAKLTRLKMLWSGRIIGEMAAVLWCAIRNQILLHTLGDGSLYLFQRLRIRTRESIPT